MVLWVCEALEVNNWTVFDSLDHSSQDYGGYTYSLRRLYTLKLKKPIHGRTDRGPTNIARIAKLPYSGQRKAWLKEKLGWFLIGWLNLTSSSDSFLAVWNMTAFAEQIYTLTERNIVPRHCTNTVLVQTSDVMLWPLIKNVLRHPITWRTLLGAAAVATVTAFFTDTCPYSG